MLTEGAWWPEDYAGPPLVSFAAEEGRELGLKLGDTLTLNILGRDLTATIASFREVRFESMGISFLIMLDPAALAGAPHTHIATVYASPEAEAGLLRAEAEAYPNITAVGVRAAIDRAAAALDEIAAATRWARGGDAPHRARGADRRRRGRRAGAGLRGGGAEDPRRQPAAESSRASRSARR